jgi:hypothetical protein
MLIISNAGDLGAALKPLVGPEQSLRVGVKVAKPLEADEFLYAKCFF